MLKKKKDKRGGSRPGAGRKASENATTVISFRVPVKKADTLRVKIFKLIEEIV